jgi:hypothetical protein
MQDELGSTVIAAEPPEKIVGAEALPARICIMVLGMHRSGTSALAGTLGLLGAALPTDPMGPRPSNPKGHFESRAVYNTHERMLEALHSAWYDLRPLTPSDNPQVEAQFKAELVDILARSYPQAGLFVLKDPRLCRFFPLARSVMDDFSSSVSVVLCIRNPLEVAQSLKVRDGLALSHGLGLWLRHILDAELQSRDEPRVFIDYADFLTDWRGSVSNIEQRLRLYLPGLRTDAQTAVDTFLDQGLRHQKSTAENLQGLDGRGWILSCYRALERLKHDPSDGDAMATMDRCRHEFADPANLFGSAITHYYREIARLRKVAAERTKQLEIVTAQRTAAQHQIAALEAERAALQAQNDELKQAVSTALQAKPDGAG